jgi:hypothetical protein
MSEHALQCAVANYLDLRGWLWCAVPNGGNRNAITGARLKAEGVKRGVPDVLIFERWTEVHTDHGEIIHVEGGPGVAIELKSPRGKPTPEQTDWLAALKKRGWRVAVCRTVDEVIEACEVIR